MAAQSTIDFFDVGIFTIGDVSRLAKIPIRKVRRWMRGYTHPSVRGKVRQPPLWEPELPQSGNIHILSFNELIEVRSIGKFCAAGVQLQIVRKAISELAETEGIRFPFSTRKIITDGGALYSKLLENGEPVSDEHGRPLLVQLGGKRQVISYDMILSSIVVGLGFENELVTSYYPDREHFPRIVVDPRRAFGHPTIDGTRLEVEVVASAYKSNPSIEYVAEWFDVGVESVADAVSFHEQFLAA